MSVTSHLRRQHDAALEQVQAMLALMDAYRPGADAFHLALSVARLLGLLRVHLAQEDVGLYPALQQCGDAEAAMIAARFVAEMGGLARDVEDYVRKWSSSAAIAADFAGFRDDSLNLFAALDARIERENTILYPLAERVGAQAWRKSAA